MYLSFSDFGTQISKRGLVTFGAGIDILQSFVYSQLPTVTSVGKIATSLISNWEEQPLERRPITVNISQCRRGRSVTQRLHDRYKLLDYVTENWTRHAAAITPSAAN